MVTYSAECPVCNEVVALAVVDGMASDSPHHTCTCTYLAIRPDGTVATQMHSDPAFYRLEPNIPVVVEESNVEVQDSGASQRRGPRRQPVGPEFGPSGSGQLVGEDEAHPVGGPES